MTIATDQLLFTSDGSGQVYNWFISIPLCGDSLQHSGCGIGLLQSKPAMARVQIPGFDLLDFHKLNFPPVSVYSYRCQQSLVVCNCHWVRSIASAYLNHENSHHSMYNMIFYICALTLSCSTPSGIIRTYVCVITITDILTHGQVKEAARDINQINADSIIKQA